LAGVLVPADKGHRIKYWTRDQGGHYDLIVEATWEKVRQNPQVRDVLLSTGDLILRPDHHQAPDLPPAWRYHEILMEIRKTLRGPVQRQNGRGARGPLQSGPRPAFATGPGTETHAGEASSGRTPATMPGIAPSGPLLRTVCCQLCTHAANRCLPTMTFTGLPDTIRRHVASLPVVGPGLGTTGRRLGAAPRRGCGPGAH